MWEHYKLDNPPKEPTGTQDSDYDKAEAEIGDEYSNPNPEEEGRLPIQDFESYSDPSFDEAWNEDDSGEISDTNVVPENLPNNPVKDFETPLNKSPEGDIVSYDGDQWMEV